VISAPAPRTTSRRASTGWKIAVVILVVLLGMSLFLNLGSLLSSLAGASSGKLHRGGGPRLESTTLEDNDSDHVIAVIDLQGVIAGDAGDSGRFSLPDLIEAQLDRAADDAVKAVILRVDSPGGEVLASDEIYRCLMRFQKDHSIPVIASMGSLAASGGYYVSAPCRWIVANELTITGSIGVIMQAWNYRGLMDKVGVAPFVFKSGKYKDMLSGTRNPSDITPEEKAMVQDLIDETFGRFKKIVAEGRGWAGQENKGDGRSLSRDWEDYADGRVLSGKEAYRLGLVDELGDFHVAVSRAKKLARISNANLVQYKLHLDFSDLFRLFGEAEARRHVVKLDLGLEAPRLKAGHMYFLSPTLLH
jgi:protease-4